MSVRMNAGQAHKVPRKSIGTILTIAIVLVLLPIAAAYFIRFFSEKDPDFQRARQIAQVDPKVLEAFGEVESVRLREKVSHDIGSGVSEIVIRLVVEGHNSNGTVYVTFRRDARGEIQQGRVSDIRKR